MGLNIGMATEGTYITVHPAINVHPLALIFVNIIVDQIWLKSTIFRLLMQRSETIKTLSWHGAILL
jgi:hypothetical protein